MALARIVTSSPEKVAALSEYLRSRGYTVELVGPGAARAAVADLEMDVEGCTAEEAMARAVVVAEEQSRPRRAIAYDITGRPVEFADEEESPAKGSNAIAQARAGLAAAWREMVESLRLYFSRLGEWIDEGRQTVREYRAQREEKRRAAGAVALQREREREAQRLSRQAELDRITQQEALQRAEAERVRREREEATRLAEAERVRHHRESAARQAEQAAAQEHARQQEEGARREEQAERERRILERYRREARADVVRERFQVEQSRTQEELLPAETVFARRETLPRPVPRGSKRDGDWKKAAVASIVLALLATLGYAAYQNRRPASPLSNRDLVNSQSVSQPVPFGTATVPPPQASTAPQASAPARGRSAVPQSDPAPVARTTAPHPARKHRARASRPKDEDMIAEDEVIVHRRRAETPTRAASGSGPKRISDLE